MIIAVVARSNNGYCNVYTSFFIKHKLTYISLKEVNNMAVIFPNNDQYIPLTRDGAVYENPSYNENPGGIDIVGESTYPAIYFATDNTHTFYRFRLRSSPLLGGGFVNYSWIILIDTDMDLVDSYEWELALRGNSNDIVLIENVIPNNPGSGFNDQAEGMPTSFPITNYDIARAVAADSMIGGVQNYFLDISIETATLKSIIGVDDDTPIRFNYLTSTNETNFNKDKMCVDEHFDECFSDFVTLATLLSGMVINKDDGTPVCKAKMTLYREGLLVDETYTDDFGEYLFTDLEAANHRIRITRCCYLPFCNCNIVEIKKNANNIYDYSLAPDCICEIKCKILEAENELIEEKERAYSVITDYFETVPLTYDSLWRYTQLLCLLNDGTAELDCCISKVLEQVTICEEERECND